MAEQNLEQPKELEMFKKLRDYVTDVAQVKIHKYKGFSLCVRASFAKCYEFNLHAWDESNSQAAFYWIPTLRGICEDIIILNFIQSLPYADREKLIAGLMKHELHNNLKTQAEYFKENRPIQSVLKSPFSETEVNRQEEEIRNIWRVHGWPNLNRGVKPPTRQIAEKQGGDILTTRIYSAEEGRKGEGDHKETRAGKRLAACLRRVEM